MNSNGRFDFDAADSMKKTTQ